ncbi:anchored repeat-type ABC transporter ATP-binding subunit [Schaalia sp. lx-260]|uniref:anchored repeat-type ABC transporter ATP-binding subunit n=1 Tax=Schaalia sp. lx-260 TaxID=2899082 RepID=UPI001E40ED7D|nr:anchored repeat-type ABC transporter ATP-binding subunit [Schaalia sp. lx-260]MCD4549209.1 anchored repeat-type ABC transporter ATP-binding subunit [Schaalia sp. lx-260]
MKFRQIKTSGTRAPQVSHAQAAYEINEKSETMNESARRAPELRIDDSHELTESAPVLDVRGLSVDLGGRRILTEIDLQVNFGEFVALIGPNGAGKTTLIRSILGLLPARSGDILSQGKKLHARHIGYVPQRHEFAWDFPLTVREVVVSGLTGALGYGRRPRLEHQRAVEEAMERADIAHLSKRIIGELSGGQRQRVLVARALALQPSLLLLDEPFTGLDMPTQERLTDLFRSLAREGHGVLMSTHDLVAALADCDRLYMVNRHVVASGRREELMDAQLWIQTFRIRENNPLLRALGVI